MQEQKIEALPGPTRALWSALRDNQQLAGFILAGGTALALHLGHRCSDDLDFVWPAVKLPRYRLARLVSDLVQAYGTCEPIDPIEGLMEFEDTGLDYHDYQQDYLVGGSVKLSFLAPDQSVRHHLLPEANDRPRVADLGEIFAMKALVSADRSRSRDWLDLYVLMTVHGFSAEDLYDVFLKSSVPSKVWLALGRMCRGKLAASDEGFHALIPDPPTIETLQAFFCSKSDEIEQMLASRRTQTPP